MNNFPLPHTAGRVGLAATAAAALAFGLAAPAAADSVEPDAYYQGNAVESGLRVNMGDEHSIGTSLFQLELESGDTLTTYCIDYETNIRDGAAYVEDDWDNYPGKGDFAEPGKVFWVLQNGYPNVGAEGLAASAVETADDGGEPVEITAEEALAATQAAIWHFSNNRNLEPDDEHPNVELVYNYLITAAEDLPQPDKTETQLSVSPDSAEGLAGETIGEFTVETNVEDVPVTLDAPEGVELVDLDSGEAVESVNDGSTVGFAVPEDAEPAEASFSLSASTEIAQGRLFKGVEEEPTQTLITTEDSTVTVSDSASVEWGEAEEPEEPGEEPTDEPEEEPSEEPEEGGDKPEDDKPAPEDGDNDSELPVTGGALAGLVAAGVAALGAGAGALYLSRKRKANGIVEDEA